MKRIAMTILTIIILAFMLSACGKTNNFSGHIEAGEYLEAIDDYSNYIRGNIDNELRAKTFLEDYLAEKRTKFSAGEISPEEMQSALECVQKIDDEFGIVTNALLVTREVYDNITVSRESFDAGVSALKSGDYKTAIEALEKVHEADKVNYEPAQDQLSAARTSYKNELISAVQAAIDEKDYEKAILLGEDGKAALGTDAPDMQQLINTAILGKANDLIDGYIAEENYEMAIRTYKDFVAKNQGLVSAELTEKIDNCTQTFLNAIVEKSKKAYFADGPEAAMSEVRNGETVLIGNSKLNALYNLYLSSVPVSYSELRFNIDNDDREEINNGATDSFGDLHTGKLIKMLAYYRTNALIGFPNYKYKSLKATIFMDSVYKKEASATVEIEGDGRSLYKSDNISRGTKPFEIDIDISGIDEVAIKITPSGTNWDYIWIEDLEFSNPLSENDIELAIQ